MNATPDRSLPVPDSRSAGRERTTPAAPFEGDGASGKVAVIRGDARALPLPDASVDLIVTSPPYWALRSYTDGGAHYAGQIGAEPTPAAYVDALIGCTREWVRVLKPTGSLWINLGDKYTTGGGHTSPGSTPSPLLHSMGTSDEDQRAGHARHYGGTVRTPDGFRPKSLIGLPWRYALRAVDDLGLILRAEVIWSKPNGLPESVTDRVRRSHEQWFHLVKQPRYYSAVDEIREPHTAPTRVPGRRSMGGRNANLTRTGTGEYVGPSPLGALPGSVWEIATQPLAVPDHLGVDHFAAFPLEWPRRIIAGWSPPGICTACSEGRRPVVEGGGYDPEVLARRGTASQDYSDRTASGKPSPLLSVNLSGPEKDRYRIPHRVTGYACACPEPAAPTRPAVVLDPFGGTGTTALAARALGRNAISVDMSADYCRLATWRCSDPSELARAMGVAKPPPVLDGQTDLLQEIANA